MTTVPDSVLAIKPEEFKLCKAKACPVKPIVPAFVIVPPVIPLVVAMLVTVPVLEVYPDGLVVG